jgi:hypothetical protein
MARYLAGVSQIGTSNDKSIAIGENVAARAKVSQFGKSNGVGQKKQQQEYRSFGESTTVLARVSQLGENIASEEGWGEVAAWSGALIYPPQEIINPPRRPWASRARCGCIGRLLENIL